MVVPPTLRTARDGAPLQPTPGPSAVSSPDLRGVRARRPESLSRQVRHSVSGRSRRCRCSGNGSRPLRPPSSARRTISARPAGRPHVRRPRDGARPSAPPAARSSSAADQAAEPGNARRRRALTRRRRRRARRCSTTSGCAPGRGHQRLRHAPRRQGDRDADKIEGIVDRVIAANGFAVTRDERAAPRRGDGRRRHRLRAARAAPQRRDDHRGHGQRARTTSTSSARGKIQRVDSVFLNDEHVLRIIDRIITPLGRRIDEIEPARRRPPARRLARQRDHRAAVAHRARHHGPEVLEDAVHGRRPHPVRDRDARDVRVPAGLHRGPAEPLRLGRHGLRQDDDPQRPVVVHPERRAHRHDRGRRRAPAPPGARHHARGAPAEPRGRGRDHDPRPAAERDAHAPRPDHRRRVPLGRGAGHAPGDDDRPRRLALDRPRQQPRRTCSGGSRRWS